MKNFFGYVFVIVTGGWSGVVLYTALDTGVISNISGGGGTGTSSHSLEDSTIMFYFNFIVYLAYLLFSLVSLASFVSKPIIALYRKIRGLEKIEEVEENEFLNHQDENDFLNYKGENDFLDSKKKS